jgi:hypothetical protein
MPTGLEKSPVLNLGGGSEGQTSYYGMAQLGAGVQRPNVNGRGGFDLSAPFWGSSMKPDGAMADAKGPAGTCWTRHLRVITQRPLNDHRYLVAAANYQLPKRYSIKYQERSHGKGDTETIALW